MKNTFNMFARALLVLVAFFLLYVSVGLGHVAYNLNVQRVDMARGSANPTAMRYAEDGAVIGGHDGPTAMWMTICGKAIPIEPTMPQVIMHGAISFLAFGGAIVLLWLAAGKRKK